MDNAAFSESGLARDLIAAAGPATLATLTASGGPFASFVVTASLDGGALAMLLSRLPSTRRT